MDAASRQAKLASLVEQMKAIHYANRLYWSPKAHSRAAEVEYQWRQERLEQVRKELEELASPTPVRMLKEVTTLMVVSWSHPLENALLQELLGEAACERDAELPLRPHDARVDWLRSKGRMAFHFTLPKI